MASSVRDIVQGRAAPKNGGNDDHHLIIGVQVAEQKQQQHHQQDSDMSSNAPGWITTKKRGRDDAQIERDRIRALEARKKERRQQKQQQQREVPAKVNGNKSKPRRRRRRHSDDESSLGSFIVNDDEEEEEDDDDDDDGLELGDDEDEDELEDEISVSSSSPPPKHLMKPPRKQQRPSHHRTKLVTTSSRHFSKNASAVAVKKQQPQRKDHKKADVVDLLSSSSSSSEDDSLLLPLAVRQNKQQQQQKQNKSSKNDVRGAKKSGRSSSSTSSETSRDVEGTRRSTNGVAERRRPNKVTLKRPYASASAASAAASTAKPRGAESSFLDDDDDNVDDDHQLTRAIEASLRQRPQGSAAPSAATATADDWDVPDSPLSPLPTKPKQHKRKRLVKHDQEHRRRRPTSAFEDEDDDGVASCSDDDEAVALRRALKESLKEAGRQKKAAAASTKFTKNISRKDHGELADTTDDEKEEAQKKKEQVIDLAGDEDDDDEGMDLDGVYDETEVAAKTVLDMANKLSAQVLAVMTKWSSNGKSDTKTSNGDDDSNDDEDKKGPQTGMIVDGALALGGLGGGADGADDQDETSRPSWISSTKLRELCPTVTLAEYQLVGVNWLALLHGLMCDVDSTNGGVGRKKQANVNGVLADEMGLGKTVQTIVFLRYLKHLSDQDPTSKRRPHLVIVPSSVLSNWEREFQTFAPDLNVVKFYGSVEEREAMQWEMEESIKSDEGSSRLDVILAPVTYFQKEKATERKFLSRFEYDYLVIDEAHVLKNAQGNRYKTLNRIRSSHRLLLTGTPVQNSPQELLTLLSFLMPSLFATGSLEYDDDAGGDDAAAAMLRHFVSAEGQKGVSDAAAYGKLKQLLAPFVLRRRKVDVLHQILPPKTREVEYVELEPSARIVYDSILEEHLKNKKAGIRTSQATTGHLFTQLRKASHHPLLLRTRYKTPAEKEHLARCFHRYGAFRGEGCTRERVAQELELMSDFTIHLTALELLHENPIGRADDLERYTLSEDDLFASAKFQRLRTLLPDLVQKGHRILLFSVWTSCLDLLSCLMDSLGLAYRRMEGSTPVAERQALMDEFNGDDGIPVFLLSTKACGLGINLTSADVCIMHDLDFNPFNDLQAEDRCHRIGQKRPVTVYKLVSLATVDEDIYKMQVRKSEMNAAIMGEEADEVSAVASSNSAKFDSAKEAKAVLRDAVDRYLRSPSSHKKSKKGGASSKENGHENESAADVVVIDDEEVEIEDTDDEDNKKPADEKAMVPTASCKEID